MREGTEAAHGPSEQFGLFLLGRSHATLLVTTAVENRFFDLSEKKLPQTLCTISERRGNEVLGLCDQTFFFFSSLTVDLESRKRSFRPWHPARVSSQKTDEEKNNIVCI